MESRTRGNITTEDFLAAFDDAEGERLAKLLDYWPLLTREIYKSLGLAPDGKTVVAPGLAGTDIERYRTAFNAMRLLNIEFLSRCCARVSQLMKRSEQELSETPRRSGTPSKRCRTRRSSPRLKARRTVAQGLPGFFLEM